MKRSRRESGALAEALVAGIEQNSRNRQSKAKRMICVNEAHGGYMYLCEGRDQSGRQQALYSKGQTAE